MSLASMMNAPSFKPEIEFEIIKLILLRERYLKRLENKLKEKKGKIDLFIINLCDVLRVSTLEIIEVIQTWERTQVS